MKNCKVIRYFFRFLFFFLFTHISGLGQNVFYVSTTNSYDLYLVDLDKCSVKSVSIMPEIMFDLAMSPSGQMYGISFGKDLYRIDKNSGVSLKISTANQQFNALVYGYDGFLYAATLAGDIFKIDPNNGNIFPLGNCGFSSGGDLTFFENKLYLSSYSGDLIEINLENITKSKLIGSMSVANIFGIITVGAVDCKGKEPKVYATGSNEIYELNIKTAIVKSICKLPITSIAGAASVSEASLIQKRNAGDDINFQFCTDNGKLDLNSFLTKDKGGFWSEANSFNSTISNGIIDLKVQSEKKHLYIYKIGEGICLDSLILELNILNSPKAEIISNKKALCKDGSMILSASQEVGHSYEWFKDGSSLNINTSSLAIIKDGNYSVKITSINTCSTTSKEFIVVQKEKPIVNISNPNGAQLCQGTTSNLTVSGNNLVGYQWLRNGSNLISETKNNLIVSQGGDYTVSVIDTNGCENTSMIEKINMVNKVEVKMDSIPLLCGINNSAIQLKGKPSGGVFNGKGIIGNEFYSNLAGIGQHKISYKVSSILTCLNGTDERDITVSPVPTVKILNPNDGKICSGDKVNISTEVKDGDVFQWYKDNLAISGAIQNNYETNVAGKYKLEVKNLNNCIAYSNEYSVEIYAKPNISLDSLPNFCGVEHPPITIKYSPSGGILSGKGISGNNFDPKIAGIGEHIISYKITGTPTCTSGEISRKVIVTSTPNLNLGPDKTIHNGQFVKLNGDLGPGYDYLWSPNIDIDNATKASPSVNPKITTTYKLIATGPNLCIAVDSINLTVLQNIYVPTVFTPNLDNFNDHLEIINLDFYPNAEVSIYDRWGKLIYFTNDYQNHKFNGFTDSKIIPMGTYNYLINNKIPSFTICGIVLLIL